MWPWISCLVTTIVRSTRSSEEVCSIYELWFVFVLVRVLENLFSYAFPLARVSDFNSTIVYILVLVTTMYLAFHVCSFTLWLSYSLWLNSNMASSWYGVFCCPPIWGTPYWEILKKVHKNQLYVLTYSQLLSTQGFSGISVKRSQFFQSVYSSTVWFSNCRPSWTNALHFSYTDSFNR
jgi:hypothetical protein